MADESAANVVDIHKTEEESKLSKDEALQLHFYVERLIRMQSQVELFSNKIDELQRLHEETQKKHDACKKDILAKYHLSDKDRINLETGEITRTAKK